MKSSGLQLSMSSSLRNSTDTALAALLAVSVAWAPLPFASVTFPFRAGLQGASGAALLLVAFAARRESLRPALPAVGIAGVGVLGILQTIPLPEGLVAVLSPEAARLRTASHEVLGVEKAAFPLSLAPDITLPTALWWIAVAGFFAAAAVAGRRRESRRWIGGAILGVALFEALYGARRWTAGATEIWGVEVPGSPARLRGTYVNSDHLAFLLALALACVFGWLWWAGKRARRTTALERAILLVAPPLLCWLTLFTALAFTGSRAAIAGILTATCLQGVLVARRQRRIGPVGLGAGLAVLGLGVVAAIGLQQGFGRWLATSPYEITWNVRLEAYAAAWTLWQRFPIVGTGLGTFRETFPLVQPETAPGGWWHAHNDWLELLTTAGIVGFIVCAAGLLALLLRLVRIFARAPRSEDRAAGLAALGALAAATLHSGLDFGLTMPANAVVLAVVSGAAAGTPLGRRRRRTGAADGEEERPSPDDTATSSSPASTSDPTPG